MAERVKSVKNLTHFKHISYINYNYINYILGMDIGSASCGYAVLQDDANGVPFKIVELNSVVFSIGETPKGQSKASQRRIFRASRRLNRRRKFRKHSVRKLFLDYHLLTKHQMKQVFQQKPMPSVYELRVKGLTQPLTNSELFQVLYYFAGHRGFHSNRKYALNNNDNKPLLKAVAHSKHRIHKNGYHTLGEMLDKDKKFKHQKTNSGTNYLFMATRSMISNEAKKILNTQIKDNHKLTKSFIFSYLHILVRQRNFDEGPSKPSPFAGNQIAKMIGRDTLDHSQKRASKATFTFKYYQLLCNLNNLRYKANVLDDWHPLSSQQKNVVIKNYFSKRSLSYKQIKSELQLPKDATFNLVNYNSYKSIQDAEKKTSIGSFKDIQEIQETLPNKLRHNHKLLDTIGEILTKYSSDDARRKAFKNNLTLSQSTTDKLLLLNFSTFGSLSLKTMRRLIPYLEKGYKLYDAIHAIGLKPVNKITASYVYHNVTNPVVLRAFTIARKVVRYVIHKYGKPDAIHIELARNLADNSQVKRNIQKYQKQNEKRNNDAKEWLREQGYEVNGQNILIKNLFDEQKGIDPYTGKLMKPDLVFNGNFYNIDHIIPYSLSFDDSFTNKALISTKANELKGNRLPLQYVKTRPQQKKNLIHFATHIIKNYKKRNKLLQKHVNTKKINSWHARNLNDTRYLNKLIANYLRQNVSFNPNVNLGKNRVVCLNGSMTAKMRHRWGLVKVRADGDKHHALDATVIACVSPALINRINKFSKYYEIKDNPKLWSKNGFKQLKHNVFHSKLFTECYNSFPLPWHDFRAELMGRLSSCPSKAMSGKVWKYYSKDEIKHLKPLFVIQKRSHKVNGPVCKQTLRSAKYLNKGYIMSRFNVSKLKLNKKGQIYSGFYKYIHRNSNGNLADYKQLKKQLEMHGGSGKKAFPNGEMVYHDSKRHLHILKKVKLFKNSTSGVLRNHGTAISDNGKVVKINLYRNSKTGKYCYVPVYLADMIKTTTPNRIARCSKKPKYLTKQDKFQFSLFPWTPIHVVFKKHRNIKWLAKDHDNYNQVKDFYGYYWNQDIAGGDLNFISSDRTFIIRGVGCSIIKKIHIL